MPNNLRDIELLKTNPHQLVLELQELIDVIINQFIRSGCINFADHDEIKQQINEELLNKIPKISSQFQGKSLLRTYLSAVIRNICKELMRKGKKDKHVYFNELIENEVGSETMNSLIFEDEIIRLKKALSLYFSLKPKIILCLKLKYKIPFDYDDFKSVISEFSINEFSDFVNFITPYQKCTDSSIFGGLTRIFNKYENKNNTPDALRKWVVQTINDLIDILNGSSLSSQYNDETFQILFEISFYNKKDVVSKIF